MRDDSNFKRALRAFLVSEFRLDAAMLRDDSKLFSSGLIDSLGVMTFVSFVEREIGSPIPPEAITLDNFDSIQQVAAFLEAGDRPR